MEEEDTYHYDFTTASELEIFIARIEEIILNWGLHQRLVEKPPKKGDFKNKHWFSSSEVLTFSEAEFTLTNYYLKCDKSEEEEEEEGKTESVEDVEVPAQVIQDMLSTENDFFPITNPPSKDSHPIARWYGLRHFLVLVPHHSSHVGSESRVKILLSALSIAINNTKCAVPFFLMALEPWQNYFVGVFQSGSYRTEFNMVHLKHTPSHCKFLTGLLTMFKSKIGLTDLLNPVTVSVRFTYVLRDSANSAWTQEPPDLDFLGGDILGASELGSLPFGSVYDSISELYLNALWPSLLENSVADSENYSDLDPLQAPIWTVSITPVDDPSCLLTDYYSEFVVLTRAKHSVGDLLGNLINSSSSAKSSDVSSSLSVLTESKISAFSKSVIGNEKTTKKETNWHSQQTDGPILPEHLMIFLYYLFPDADSASKCPYKEDLGGTLSSDLTADEKQENIKKKLSGMKSAPFDGLLWRLCHVMAHVIHSLGGVRAAAYLWYEFTQELRFRWENCILMPGLKSAFPDPRTCLLNQKLQLLNCCISKRIERDRRANEKVQEQDEGDSESEEEFYDCDADLRAEEEESGRRKVKHAPWDKPIGRLSRHGDLKLLETGEPLYVPVTQDPVPKTEDQLEEDEEALLQLGNDAQGSQLRAKLMSASLLSDMEAFKAANPGCVLADFIRWCSPRDWVEEAEGLDEFGQRKGHLSKRMEIPGNTWMEVWQVAQPVPAKWQRRLFNDTRESEKVLDFLERKTPKEFIELLLPVMIVCVIKKLLEESEMEELPGTTEVVSKLIKKAELLGRIPKIEGSSYEELINEISAVETVVVHARSLKRKFIRSEGDERKADRNQEDVNKFIKSLLSGAETEVPGGPKSEIGFIIRNYFSEVTKTEQLIPDSMTSPLTSEKWNVMSPFPFPHEKEMILRLSKDEGPQRLHAVLKKNECRLCGAFTKNIYFP